MRCGGGGGDGEKQMRSQLSRKTGLTNGLYVERTRVLGAIMFKELEKFSPGTVSGLSSLE